jgi:general stress protein YciG
VSGDRAHMAEIGREGGHRRQNQRHEDSTPPDEPEVLPYTENHVAH